MPLEVDVLTLFPPMVEGPLGESIPARIQDRGLATVRVHDLRQWGLGRHRTVADYNEMFWPQVVRGVAIMFCLLPPTRLALESLSEI